MQQQQQQSPTSHQQMTQQTAFDPTGRSGPAAPSRPRVHDGYAAYAQAPPPMPLPMSPPAAAAPPAHPHAHAIQAQAHAAAAAAAAQYAHHAMQYYPAPPAAPHAYHPSDVAAAPAAAPPPALNYPATFDPTPYMGGSWGGGSFAAFGSMPPAVPMFAPPPAPAASPEHGTAASFDAEAELLFLVKLERKAFSLQQKGHHLYAIELMEQSVASRKLLYGPLSAEVMAAAEKLALLYNSLAMSSLYKEEYKQSLRLLRKAELLTSHISQLTSVRVQTLNNLACTYRRLQRPKTALNLLRESLVLLSAEQTIEGRPVTHLNMCAILSQLNRHEEALEHAKAAVMHCQKQLLQDDSQKKAADKRSRRQRRRDAAYDDSELSDESYQSDTASESSSATTESTSAATAHQLLTEKIVILGISYHNLGVEEEFMQQWDACLEWYGKALQLARDHVGEKEEITKTFRDSYLAAKKQIELLQAQSAPRSTSRAGRASRPASAASGRSGSTAPSSYPSYSPPASSHSRASSAVRSRPASAAPARERASSQSRPAHSASQADFRSQPHQAYQQPTYLQGTAQSSGRQRPKSASISRPPRPR